MMKEDCHMAWGEKREREMMMTMCVDLVCVCVWKENCQPASPTYLPVVVLVSFQHTQLVMPCISCCTMAPDTEHKGMETEAKKSIIRVTIR